MKAIKGEDIRVGMLLLETKTQYPKLVRVTALGSRSFNATVIASSAYSVGHESLWTKEFRFWSELTEDEAVLWTFKLGQVTKGLPWIQ